MKRIHKILLTALLTLGLLLVPVHGKQGAGAAGLPTIDVSNLIQNILDYIQSQDLAGLAETLSGKGVELEEYLSRIEDMRRYIAYAQRAIEIYQCGKDIINTSLQIVEQGDYLYKSMMYFRERNALPSVAGGALCLWKDFNSLSTDFLEEEMAKIREYQKMGMSGNALMQMQAMDDMVRDIRDRVFSIIGHYRMSVSELYSYQKAFERAFANNGFLNTVYY